MSGLHDQRAEPDAFFDVVVVGAGPAGCVTALVLARRGKSVLLVDRAAFPRFKVCGGCINPRALEVLRGLGQGGLAARLGAVPISSFTLGCAGRQATIRQPLGVALSRSAFDAALANAACNEGATFRDATQARLGSTSEPPFLDLRLRSENTLQTVRSRFVVSATGLTDSLRSDSDSPDQSRHAPVPTSASSKIGAATVSPLMPDGYASGRIHMPSTVDGYVGLVGLEDGRLNIAAALDPQAVRRARGIGALVSQILADAGFPEVPGVAELAWKGTPPLTRSAPVLASNGLFRVGDAAGYVEPFTGEGMAWGLSAGVSLGNILADAIEHPNHSPEAAWIRSYRREVKRTQLICRAARWALRVPWITRSLVWVLDLQPALARPLLHSMHQTHASRSVRSAGGPGLP